MSRRPLVERLEAMASARIDWQKPETVAQLLREAAAALAAPPEKCPSSLPGEGKP